MSRETVDDFSKEIEEISNHIRKVLQTEMVGSGTSHWTGQIEKIVQEMSSAFNIPINVETDLEIDVSVDQDDKRKMNLSVRPKTKAGEVFCATWMWAVQEQERSDARNGG